MATTDRATAEPADATSDVANALVEADLVQLVTLPHGDCLAAAGLLAAACRESGVPYHVSVAGTGAAVTDRLQATDDGATPVLVGTTAGDAVALAPVGPVSPLAYAAADAAGTAPDATAALAGVIAGGAVPSQATPSLLEAAGLDRQPGIAVPTAELADGVAHSGLFHAAFSGDPAAAGDALAEVALPDAAVGALTDDEARRAGSFLALAAGAATDAPPSAARAVDRALRPYRIDGPFETLGGYADVLTALASRAPGLAVALVVGADSRDAALEAWRAHGRATHAAVRDADTARYSGLVVARTTEASPAVARLLRDYRAPEPVVLAVGDGKAAVAATERAVTDPLQAAADAAGGSMSARGNQGTATFDPNRTERFVEAFREAR